MSAEGFSAPEHLTAEHDVSAFDSGTPELDNWLKRRALANEALGTSRTYVVTAGGRVVAFYALANGAVAHKDVSAKTRRNLPDPIPVMVLARLAVDSAYQNKVLVPRFSRTPYSAPSRPLKSLVFARCCFMRCLTGELPMTPPLAPSCGPPTAGRLSCSAQGASRRRPRQERSSHQAGT